MYINDTTPTIPSRLDPTWPPEVGIILSSLEVGHFGSDRRLNPRYPYHVKAALRLFTDAPDAPLHLLYTRDVNQKSLGFITNDCLPLGYGGTVELVAMNGKPIEVHCTLLRCRQAAQDWYEGALYFNREQWEFEPETNDGV
jgi:hypothetical protein